MSLSTIFRVNYNVFFLLIIILFPKTSLFSVGELSQGVRVDDFIILGLFVSRVLSSSIRWPRSLVYLLIIISFLTYTYILFEPNEYNLLRVFGPLRLFEYFVFFDFSASLSIAILTSTITASFVIQMLVGSLQVLYFGNYRASGLTAGPWEFCLCVSTLLIPICRYMLFPRLRLIYFFGKQYLYLIFSTFAVIISSSRISIPASLLTTVLINSRDFKSTSQSFLKIRANSIGFTFIASLLSVVTIIAVSQYLPDLYIFKSTDLKQFTRSIDYFVVTLNSIFSNPRDFLLSFDSRLASVSSTYYIDYDPSLLARIHAIFRYVATAVSSNLWPLFFMTGAGTHFAGITLDSMYIKSLIDFGIPATFSFLFISMRLFFKHPFLRSYLVLWLITSFTLDVLWASKATYALLLCLAYEFNMFTYNDVDV